MSERAEVLFKQLQSAKAIRALIGQSEDGDFDCKEWHGTDSMKASIAKAACGFANAKGGVIVIGMSTKRAGQSAPDVVTGEKPVADREAVKSELLDIILKQVDPGITGVRAHGVADKPRAKSGFVLLYIPELDGTPQRSRVDWRFYVRIASGTVPMEYFQIEDRFGRRPHARLVVDVQEEEDGIGELRMMRGSLVRRITVYVSNVGRGMARFPAVRYHRSTGLFVPGPMEGNQPIWMPYYADTDWPCLRGTANDVVYPGDKLRIVTLCQRAAPRTDPNAPTLFPAMIVATEAVCEGMPAHRQSFAFDAAQQ